VCVYVYIYIQASLKSDKNYCFFT